MDYLQALSLLSRSLHMGVSHHNGDPIYYKQVGDLTWGEVGPTTGYLLATGKHPALIEICETIRAQGVPKNPILFFVKINGEPTLGLVEKLEHFWWGHYIRRKFIKGYGERASVWHLQRSMSELAEHIATETESEAHGLYLADWGNPKPLALLVRGLPEPALN